MNLLWNIYDMFIWKNSPAVLVDVLFYTYDRSMHILVYSRFLLVGETHVPAVCHVCTICAVGLAWHAACCICMHARLSVRTQDPGWMWYLTRVHITLINYVRIAVEDQSISNYPCLELDRFSCIWFLLPESRNKSTSAWVVQNQTTLGLKFFRQKYQHLRVWGIPKV
jgi:hypothetical protein